MTTYSIKHSRFSGIYAGAILSLLTVLSGCSNGGGSSSTKSSDKPSSSSSKSSSSTSSSSSSASAQSFTISGTIEGNLAPITLSLNAEEQSFTGNTFTFTEKVKNADPYGVRFVSAQGEQTCIVKGGSGIARSDVTNIQVICAAPLDALRYVDLHINGEIASGDFNGDGFADMAFTAITLTGHPSGVRNHVMRIVFGNGLGGFAQDQELPILEHPYDEDSGNAMVVGRFNNDAYDDLVMGSFEAIEVFTGAATGLQKINTIHEGLGTPVRLADLDGNGFDDIIADTLGGSFIQYFGGHLAAGNGSFAEPVYSGSKIDAETKEFGTPSNFIMGNFTADSIPDILAIMPKGDDLVLGVFAGTGDGHFEYPAALDTLSRDLFLEHYNFEQSHKDMAYGDIDGDGDLDVVLTSTTTFLEVLTNDGTGHFSAHQRIEIGREPARVAMADFNKDGTLDIASLNDGSSNLVIALGKGGGTFGGIDGDLSGFINLKLNEETDPQAMTLADFNQDGYMDIAVIEGRSQINNVGIGSVLILLSPGLPQ